MRKGIDFREIDILVPQKLLDKNKAEAEIYKGQHQCI
jgi:hypothetical protein